MNMDKVPAIVRLAILAAARTCSASLSSTADCVLVEQFAPLFGEPSAGLLKICWAP